MSPLAALDCDLLASESGAAHTGKPLVYACSGCSDAGELADRIARLLNRNGVAEMSCIAGIGGRVLRMLAKTHTGRPIVIIDGCPLNCARRSIEFTRVHPDLHVELHRLGFKKGSCPATPETIERAAQAVINLVTAMPKSSTSKHVAKVHWTGSSHAKRPRRD